jgi:hypothetical protein
MTQQMMWITFVPAIAGLLGVLVGAAITAWANYWLAVRKEKAGEAKDKLSRAIVSDEEKIEIDFRRKETEEGWIRIHDKFGLKGAPVWFSWLSWILALGAFHYLFLKTSSIVVGVVIAISYQMLWLYFNGFFYRLDFKGIPMVSTGRRQQIASLLLSGVIACLFGWLAITIASKLAALQQSR